MKSRIVEHLGQAELLLPSRIAAALAANDRAKLRMTVLQAAAQRARYPAGTPPDFAAECRAAGIDPRPVRALVVGVRPQGAGAMTAPGLGQWGDALLADIDEMIHAVAAGDEAEGARAAARLAAVRGELDHASPDQLELAQVARQMGKPCVVGCADLAVDAIARSARLRDAIIEEGDWLSLDGDSGAIYLGARETVREEPGAELAELERWREQARQSARATLGRR